MGKCYICWHTTHQRSPCPCGMAVHDKCLRKWLRRKNSPSFPKRYCSVCKGLLRHRVVYWYLFFSWAAWITQIACAYTLLYGFMTEDPLAARCFPALVAAALLSRGALAVFNARALHVFRA